MIIANIDFKKIDKARLKDTGKSAYGDLVFIDSPRERNGKRIDGFVKQGVSKEDRESRIEMPILGDWWHVGAKPKEQVKTKQPEKPSDTYEDEEIPF